jgi:hypothetical protein
MRPAVGTGRADAMARNPLTGTARTGRSARVSGNRSGEIATRNASLIFSTRS